MNMPVQKYLDHYQSNLKGHQCVTCMVYVKILRKITQKFINIYFHELLAITTGPAYAPIIERKIYNRNTCNGHINNWEDDLETEISSLVGHKPDRQTDIPVCIRTCCCR